MTSSSTLTVPSRSNLPRQGVELRWPYDITQHGLTAYVVEPFRYEPAAHGEIFQEIITAALTPGARGGRQVPARRGLKTFDLMTFPEAFVTPETLLETLEVVRGLAAAPLFHVGLRAAYDGGHLFSVAETVGLVQALKKLLNPGVVDLDPLELWLDSRDTEERYNLACVFTVDADQHLRLCLHPKNTPSPVEIGSLPEDTVTATEFLSVVTLAPTDVKFRKVHLQPVICSDLLDLRTSTGSGGPLAAMANPAGKLDDPPDVIDIVSAVTCTRQANASIGERAASELSWHSLFRSTFEASLNGTIFSRHLGSVFVLSNFRFGPEGPDGRLVDQGLSGCFAPTRPYRPAAPGSQVWSYGRIGQEDRIWELDPPHGFTADAQLVTLNPTAGDSSAAARLMRFSIPLLMRFQGAGGVAGPSAVEVLDWTPHTAEDETLEEISNV